MLSPLIITPSWAATRDGAPSRSRPGNSKHLNDRYLNGTHLNGMIHGRRMIPSSLVAIVPCRLLHRQHDRTMNPDRRAHPAIEAAGAAIAAGKLVASHGDALHARPGLLPKAIQWIASLAAGN